MRCCLGVLALAASLVTVQVAAQNAPPGHEEISPDQLPMSFQLEGWQDRSWVFDVFRNIKGSGEYSIRIFKDTLYGKVSLVSDKQGFLLPQTPMRELIEKDQGFKGARFTFGAEGSVTQGTVTYRYILFEALQNGGKGHCLYTLGDWRPGFLEGWVCHPTKPMTEPAAQVFLKSLEIQGVNQGAAGSLN